MPSVGTGARWFANRHLKANWGQREDGDTGGIGLGQFKHAVRRNVADDIHRENNGVYETAKGRWSAITADEGQTLQNMPGIAFPPVDVCMQALVAGAGLSARSLRGDAKQVAVLKAALSHKGTAVIDIISPCVAFNSGTLPGRATATAKNMKRRCTILATGAASQKKSSLRMITARMRVVEMPDGSFIQLRKLETDYDQQIN